MPARADAKFLKALEDKAKSLAKRLASEDHWAKPYYSDVQTFVPGVTRAFMGINPGGDRYSHQLNIEDDAERRIWYGSALFHNAYLDERWGTDQTSTRLPGASPLQVSVRKVFETIGDSWEEKLRETACFNLIPVSSRKADDPMIKCIWDDGVAWGIELIEYLKPGFIILNGNGETLNGKAPSAWSELRKRFGLVETRPGIELGTKYSVKDALIQSGVLKGARVVGLPHLSRERGPEALMQALKSIGPFA